jgi:hypothetical protein
MPSHSEQQLVSQVTRRNSTIEIWSTENRTWLRKTYHARYQVRDEADAYHAFQELLSGEATAGIRTAEVYDVVESQNALDLEYVQGPTIAEELAAKGCGVLTGLQDRLLKLLVMAHKEEMHFDSDPTNFIIESRSNDLILIDPICAKLDLSHFSAVVFCWGIIKSFVSHAYRLDRWWGYFRGWKSLRADYLKMAECPPHVFSQELSQYIATVITWNIEESSQEKLLKRLIRWTLLIPLWFLFRVAFRSLAFIERRCVSQ